MEVPTRRASLTHELETIRTSVDSGVLFATFNTPPINLIGPELVRDLIDLMDRLEQDKDVRVVVFASADEEFFSPHVDIARVAEYTKETSRISGSASGSLGGLLRGLSIAINGREFLLPHIVRGAVHRPGPRIHLVRATDVDSEGLAATGPASLRLSSDRKLNCMGAPPRVRFRATADVWVGRCRGPLRAL
jgi:hypothetical protein